MPRERNPQVVPQESLISIIGPGMRVTGDCETEGSLRIEGQVKGTVRAGKAVVIGRDAVVEGDVFTQDAVVSGTVLGSVTAHSRLELQASCRVDGDVQARRLQLEEGAILNGSVHMTDESGSGADRAGPPLGGSGAAAP